MAVETRQLRIKARKLGASNVREMSRDELEDYIAEHSSGNGKKSKKGKVSKASKAVKVGGKNKVKRGRPAKVRDDEDDEDEAPRKRGRPKGSKNKATEAPKRRGRPPKAESERKQTRKRTGAVGRPPGSGSGTRVSVPETIKWNRDFDFRDGSTAQYILNQLRKSAKKYEDTADIREDTFDKLVEKINKVDELTFQNRAAGKPHKGEKAEQMLRYRINRTIFDYCVETGQHDAEGNGGSKKSKSSSKGNKTSTTGKNKVKRGRPRKVVEDDDDDDDEDEAPKKRGRPKGSKNKATVVKRGRPKGSKNKKSNSDDDDIAALKARIAELEGGKKKRGRPKGSKNKARA